MTTKQHKVYDKSKRKEENASCKLKRFVKLKNGAKVLLSKRGSVVWDQGRGHWFATYKK